MELEGGHMKDDITYQSPDNWLPTKSYPDLEKPYSYIKTLFFHDKLNLPARKAIIKQLLHEMQKQEEISVEQSKGLRRAIDENFGTLDR